MLENNCTKGELPQQAVEQKYPFYTVKQTVNRNPCVTNGGLRHQIFNAETNGLAESGAIIRIGRKVLIDEDKYFDWLTSHAS